MTNERTISQVEAEIAQVQNELNDVHGTQTEVYARIVGYYRAVRNWNKGKADEFKHRKMFTLEDSNRYDGKTYAKAAAPKTVKAEAKTENTVASNEIASYDIFVRKTCPNCPPVKAYMANVNLKGNMIDVDTPEGLDEAALKGVFAAPTVIVYNEAHKEIARGHSVEELTAIFEPAVAIA
ncbi:anaerobic ribonucleoside-triphosphate reductase [Treponema sp.]|uniref:anaerobic ribonucleoside-triphosphate reductase n=1 Tax=Treponema sp. TaxID=166 RepID=UPI00298E5D22|nr:anaerobic ribonucleoside-triphosphate reductase [Treponema sp.]MCR5613333.1 hypothetical protein [Treponema sp.]